MKYILYFGLGVFLFFIINPLLVKSNAEHYTAPVVATTTPVVQAVKPVVKRKPTEAQMALINKKALEYDVSTTTITRVIECESGFVETARGDGGYSRGLVQIHSKYHPDVTYEQAVDPEFAIDFLAKKLSENKGHLWTCYRLLVSR